MFRKAVLAFGLAALFFTILASSANAGDDDPFSVIKVVPGCSYFIIQTPAWKVIAEDWMCSMPSEGDRGTGDLIGYFAKHVVLNGSKCDLWVETWGSDTTVMDRLADKCGISR